MLPRKENRILALMAALLIVLGSLGVYAAEASAFRSTISQAEAIDANPSIVTADFGDGPSIPVMAGGPY